MDAARKVVLVGPHAAGKTSLILRASIGFFSPDQVPSVGAACTPLNVAIGRRRVSLSLWDTAGQERYRSLIPRYSEGSAGIILVFDLASSESYQAAKEVLAEVRQNHSPSSAIWFLVGNKSDKCPDVFLDDAKDFAEAEGMIYIQTSAKTGDNVTELFGHVASLLEPLDSAHSSQLPLNERLREQVTCC
jgi:Ras-related protein Rab-5C